MKLNTDAVIIYKRIGQTPLEALEEFRASKLELKDVPMTYAGRLDPMAEGKLLILIGDECKKKEEYLGLDKEYEVEIVFGISTDTFDSLGIVKIPDVGHLYYYQKNLDFSRYVGPFTEVYPPYSSKTINGRQLHELARSNELPEEMPTKEVEIYSIELIGERLIPAHELKATILRNISKVAGDFRQKEIGQRWDEILSDSSREFKAITLRISCSSGTYMRSLADRMGKDTSTGAFALSIKRTKMGGM